MQELSCNFDDCVERKYEPVIHDELTKEEVRALVGKPVCEIEDVWVFPDDELCFCSRMETLQTGRY